jgi:hypothetical protein
MVNLLLGRITNKPIITIDLLGEALPPKKGKPSYSLKKNRPRGGFSLRKK